AIAHWNKKKEKINKAQLDGQHYNPKTLELIFEFKNTLQKRQAQLFFTYPCFMRSSYENCSTQIIEVKNKIKNNNLHVLGTPERYSFPDSLYYNTYYHLIELGANLRSDLLIEDILKNKIVKKF